MRTVMSCLVLATILPLGTSVAGEEKKADDSTPSCPLIYINTAFENASPLYWEIGDSGEVNVFLMYDHERASPNRAAGHWHFRVEAPKGACPGPTNLYASFGWADLPIPPPERVVKNRWTRTVVNHLCHVLGKEDTRNTLQQPNSSTVAIR